MNSDEFNPPPATPPPLPPRISPEQVDEWQARWRPRWAWAIHLILFAGYVLGIGLIGHNSGLKEGEKRQSILQDSSSELLQVALVEMAMFGAMVALALAFSRASGRQLLLKWKEGAKTIAWGAFYSLVLRLGIAILTLILLAPIFLSSKDPKALEEFRPKTENLINPKALEDPLYLALTLTVISFVVAGFREELWRAGVLAGLRGVAPQYFSTRKGQYAAVMIAAVIFGLGHLPQGYGGAIMTGALGVGLGIIMVRHQSIWEAVFAHGFFNATSFALLFIMLKYFPDKFPGLPAGLLRFSF